MIEFVLFALIHVLKVEKMMHALQYLGAGRCFHDDINEIGD